MDFINGGEFVAHLLEVSAEMTWCSIFERPAFRPPDGMNIFRTILWTATSGDEDTVRVPRVNYIQYFKELRNGRVYVLRAQILNLHTKA